MRIYNLQYSFKEFRLFMDLTRAPSLAKSSIMYWTTDAHASKSDINKTISTLGEVVVIDLYIFTTNHIYNILVMWLHQYHHATTAGHWFHQQSISRGASLTVMNIQPMNNNVSDIQNVDARLVANLDIGSYSIDSPKWPLTGHPIS